jgi:predicted DNA-binding transcriptional regulator AlpA
MGEAVRQAAEVAVGSPRWLSVAEVLEALPIGKAKLYELWAKGQGPRRTRVGSRVLVRADHLTEWCDSLTESR